MARSGARPMLVSSRVAVEHMYNVGSPNYVSIPGIGNRVTAVTLGESRRPRIDAMPGAGNELGERRAGGESVDNFDPYAKYVPRAALGKDVLRVRRIGLELSPQPQDLRVHRSVIDVIVVQARHVEELVARKHAIGRPEQNHEETELAVAERDGHAVAVPQ